MAKIDTKAQGTLTRNLRKPLGTSLLHSASDWMFRGFPEYSTVPDPFAISPC